MLSVCRQSLKPKAPRLSRAYASSENAPTFGTIEVPSLSSDAPVPKLTVAEIVARRRQERLAREEADKLKPKASPRTPTPTSVDSAAAQTSAAPSADLQAKLAAMRARMSQTKDTRPKDNARTRPGSKKATPKRPVQPSKPAVAPQLVSSDPWEPPQAADNIMPADLISKDFRGVFTSYATAELGKLSNVPSGGTASTKARLRRTRGGDYSTFVPKNPAVFATPISSLNVADQLEVILGNAPGVTAASRGRLTAMVANALQNSQAAAPAVKAP